MNIRNHSHTISIFMTIIDNYHDKDFVAATRRSILVVILAITVILILTFKSMKI